MSLAVAVAGELYVTGGYGYASSLMTSVEKYSPSSDAWSTMAPLPEARAEHAAVAVGSALYVLGGKIYEDDGDRTMTVSVL
jgi:N-acetylneuraminic acid mutarotase